MSRGVESRAMLRYSLRTQIVVMLLGGPAQAGIWWSRGYLNTFGVSFVVINAVMATIYLLAWMNFHEKETGDRLLLLAVVIGWLLCSWFLLPIVFASRE